MEGIMYRFATTLIAGIIATVLVSSIGFMPTAARAAKLSNAERIALDKGDRCMQSRGEGHEVQLALAEAPEIRPKLHHKVGQQTGHRHLGSPQSGEYGGPADPGTGRLHLHLLKASPVIHFGHWSISG